LVDQLPTHHLLLALPDTWAAEVIHGVLGLAFLHPRLPECRVGEEAETEQDLERH
jgi:hypothetical protein